MQRRAGPNPLTPHRIRNGTRSNAIPAHARYLKSRQVWEVVYSDHERRRHRKSFGRGEQARKAAEETARAHNDREASRSAFFSHGPGDRLPVDRVCREWFCAYRETFSRGYEALARGLIENHIAPYFGALDLREIRERHVLGFATHVVTRGRRTIDPDTGAATESGLSVSVAKSALTILRRVSQMHVNEGLLDRNHLVGFGRLLSKIEKRRSKGVRKRGSWTVEELRGILELAREHEPALYPAVVFASHTGARRGELLGIRWSSIDFARGVVTISEQLGENGEGAALKEGHERVVRVPMGAAGPLLREVLEDLARKRILREPWAPPELVFPRLALRSSWERLRARFPERGIRPMDWHSFRATFITLALTHGGPRGVGNSIKVVSEWVGHSSTYITEHYAHVLPEADVGLGFLEEPAAKPRLVTTTR